MTAAKTLAPTRAPRLWMPDRVTFTADALREPWGEQIRARVEALALPRAKGGGGYPIGLVVAPIVAVPEWQTEYTRLLDDAQAALPAGCDLTWELITHRFTPGSRETLLGWYPNSTLEMVPETRIAKRNKFGGIKHVYPRDAMREMRGWFEREIAARFPGAPILYWT
ncbi:MAG: hypothetical protein H0X52_10190 [Gemmatimonadetes bacterium]|nr:hypothetical protein [Gemmatimonadota bacterium]